MGMSVVFRADASQRIGSGHLMRCLTLGDALREHGAAVAFVCREAPGLAQLVERHGFELHSLPPESGGEAAPESENPDWADDANRTLLAVTQSAERPAWLVVDHYGLDAKWEQALRGAVDRILVIDDLANRRHDCDLLLDQNLVADMRTRYRESVPADCPLLLGPDYALLQPLYADLHRQVVPRSGRIRRLLIFFGGADRRNLTGRVLGAFLDLGHEDVQADVVLTAGSPWRQAILEQARAHPNVHVHEGLPTLAPLIAGADLGVGATGATTWERLCLGLPALVVTLADNQRPLAQELHRRGLVHWLGDEPAVDRKRIAGILDSLFQNEIDAEWSARCLSTVDGRGTARVRAALTTSADAHLQVRAATLNDEALLLDWANDPVTRRQAFSSHAIAPGSHAAWLRDRLGRPDACRLYIVETADGVPIGQVRFDRRENGWEIDYALGPAFRRRGLGRRLLAIAMQELWTEVDVSDVFGWVKEGNLVSRRVFESLGFVRAGEGGGAVEYRVSR